MKTILDAARSHGVEHPDHYKVEGFMDGAFSVMGTNGSIDWMHMGPASWEEPEVGRENMPTVAAIDDIMARCAWALKLPRNTFLMYSAIDPPAPGSLVHTLQSQLAHYKAKAETDALKASVESSTLDALKRAHEQLAHREGAIERVVEQANAQIVERNEQIAKLQVELQAVRDKASQAALTPMVLGGSLHAQEAQGAGRRAQGDDVVVHDALRAALVELRMAIDNAEIADQFEGTILSMVDFILAKTEA